MADIIFGLIALGSLLLFASGVWFGARLARSRSPKEIRKRRSHAVEIQSVVEGIREISAFIISLRSVDNSTAAPRKDKRISRKGTAS